MHFSRFSGEHIGEMSNPSNVRLLYLARGIRGFGDGFATIVLPAYLDALGYDPVKIGIVLTGSLLGTAVFTLAIGWIAPRHDLRTLLLGGTAPIAVRGAVGCRRSVASVFPV